MSYEVLIQGDNIITKSIIYAAQRYSNKNKLTLTPQKNKRDAQLPGSLYCLGIGKHTIHYNEHEIDIFYTNEEEAKEVDCRLIKYIELIFKADTKEIIDDFIEHCKTIYQTEIKNQEITDKKITCYVYDVDYWCKLNKIYKRNMESLCFDNDEHTKLLEEIKQFISSDSEKEYRSFGIPYKMNILLEGFPGTGKTSLVYAVASHLNMDVCLISFDAKMNDVALMRAIKRTPENSIIVFEDIDVLFKQRKENDTNSGISFSGLLNCLDGISSSYGQIIFMTTNFCCNLDIALKRPGRVDYNIHFDYATKNQKEQLYDKFFPNSSCKPEIKKKFLKIIGPLKLTTAILQQYLFSNRKSRMILENIDELKDLVEKNNYDSTNLNLYT